jgi:hypothetical protein
MMRDSKAGSMYVHTSRGMNSQKRNSRRLSFAFVSLYSEAHRLIDAHSVLVFEYGSFQSNADI